LAVALDELAKLVPEFGGWALAGLVIGAGVRLAGKEDATDEIELITSLQEGIALAKDHGLRVKFDQMPPKPEIIATLAAAIGAKAAAVVIGAAVGSKAVDGF